MHFLLTGSNPKPLSRSSPRAKRHEISDALNAVVEHATALDLQQRYETVQWLATDLKQVMRDPADGALAIDSNTEKSDDGEKIDLTVTEKQYS